MHIYRALMMSGYLVGRALTLGSSLGCEWAWALIQALEAYRTRGLPFY